ncbi:MAG: hypothetical protein AAF497_06545 [Planctomycetota bacterium]
MKNFVIALIAFSIPLGIAIHSKRDEIRPYLVGDPKLTKGRMIYFSARG